MEKLNKIGIAISTTVPLNPEDTSDGPVAKSPMASPTLDPRQAIRPAQTVLFLECIRILLPAHRGSPFYSVQLAFRLEMPVSFPGSEPPALYFAINGPRRAPAFPP